MTMRRRFVALVGAMLLTIAVIAPAGAISYGQRDTGNDYPNVGAIIRALPFPDGSVQPVIWCSGTLIDDDVVLTAAHCLQGDDATWVSFAPQLTLSDPDQGIVDLAASGAIAASSIHPHPDAFCCGMNDAFDIGVVILSAAPGIAPAQLPTLNQLGQMSNAELRAAEFTTAGYGAVRQTRKGAFQNFVPTEGWRSYADQSVLSLTKAWLSLSMNQATGDGGTCYGDSGGPHFLGSTVMSVTVTGDRWCKALDKTYRVDTAVARAFLDDFVDLP